MKRLIFLAALALTGCSTMSPVKIIGQLKNDPATVALTMPTPWGLMKLVRTNPGTNSTVSVTPEGVVTIKRE